MSAVSSAQTSIPEQAYTNGRHARLDTPPTVSAIPLTPDLSPQHAEASLGGLVKEATTHLSTLIRSEVELAKAEVTAEVRKGVKGSIFFVVALTVLLFSLFFAFLAIGEILDIWLPRSAAFGIVFVLMLLIAGAFGFLGYLRVRSIRKPERTITSMRESAQAVARRGAS
ncbi:MAG: phage holin family protein [Actinomycetota bacterium]|nr:phage holin family protein [Actinomycetota bacterium]